MVFVTFGFRAHPWIEDLGKKYVHDGTRDAADRGSHRATGAHSRPHDNSGSDGFCCRLCCMGLYLSGNPDWDRIVSATDPGGTPPHYGGLVPLSDPSLEDRDQAYRS